MRARRCKGTCPARLSVTEKVAFDINEFCEAFGVGRSFVYQELAEGRLKAKKVGRKNLITKQQADEWLAALPDARAA